MAQKFHKFRGTTLEQAYAKMRKALGDDAVVLRTSTVRDGGLLGFFTREHVELTASATMRHTTRSPRPIAPVERKYRASKGPSSADAAVDRIAYYERLVGEAQKRMSAPPQPSVPAARQAPQTATAPIIPFRQPEPPATDAASIRKDISELREMVQVLMSETPGAGLPADFAPHYRALLDAGVPRKLAASLISDVLKTADIEMLRDARVFNERLKLQVQHRLKTTGGISLEAGACKLVALIGSTGVGKTTTIAKLASQYAVRERGRVALVTSDTYRVAAVEQLRVYANIIGLELRVVHDAREMAAVRREFLDYDLVLMDTAGGSQFNVKQTAELNEILRAARPQETILVTSANVSLEDLRHVVANFGCLSPSSLLFTKLDETRRYGPLFGLACETGLPLSYLSVGQNVPDDLVLAHPGMVSNLLLEGKDRRGRSSTETS